MEKTGNHEGFDRLTALDANEVKALFAQLRSSPHALASIRRTFDKLLDRLTPSGLAAYQRELSKLLQSVAELPQNLGELLDGEYGLVIRGEDGTETLATLCCANGSLTLMVPCGLDPEDRPTVVIPLGVDGYVDTVEPQAKGTLETRDGYLFLDLEITLKDGERTVCQHFNGIGDTRPGRA